MRFLRAFGRFWYGFIIGDDWRVAAGSALALVLTWVLAHDSIAAWWLLPLATAGLLWLSLRREVRRERREPRAG